MRGMVVWLGFDSGASMRPNCVSAPILMRGSAENAPTERLTRSRVGDGSARAVAAAVAMPSTPSIMLPRKARWRKRGGDRRAGTGVTNMGLLLGKMIGGPRRWGGLRVNAMRKW